MSAARAEPELRSWLHVTSRTADSDTVCTDICGQRRSSAGLLQSQLAWERQAWCSQTGTPKVPPAPRAAQGPLLQLTPHGQASLRAPLIRPRPPPWPHAPFLILRWDCAYYTWSIGVVPSISPTARSSREPLRTIVRYPALGPVAGTDLRNAPAARSEGPFPLVIFGHGFSVTPAVYAHLLEAWARAGYLVAAPVFPLGNANAPGGPNESDLPNQPTDMRFIISKLLAIGSADSGPLAGLVNPKAIAVSGQSDGGDTALTAAYNANYRDRRITAAAVLSGAEIPGMGGYTFPPGSPPLLATQGTADTINTPAETELFFNDARRPKYLLRLLGAEHLPPYRSEQPQLGVVKRVTLAFFDAYLKHEPEALHRLTAAGHVEGIASLVGYP